MLENSSQEAYDIAQKVAKSIQNGVTLAEIAYALGKIAARSPIPQLPVKEPLLFNAQIGLEMERHYRQGVIFIERLKKELQGP